jgi:SAM-dependent methyltransferase
MTERNLEKAALRGEPSYVWRSGQERRLQMILGAAGERIQGRVLENGCGVGIYLSRLADQSSQAIGLEYDLPRAQEAHQVAAQVINAAGEMLPLRNYKFGNIPLVNYLPRSYRDRLVPHVRVYSSKDLEKLFSGLPVHFVERKIIFGAYDNIIARRPRLGQQLRGILQGLEASPARIFGLSHFWVVEKI